MAVIPTNPLIRIAELDTTLPNTGNQNKVEPSSDIRTIGYDKGETYPAEYVNYSFDNIADWVQYVTERTDELQAVIDSLTLEIEQGRVSVGEIIEITGDSTNPATLKGYGTWSLMGAGVTLVGVGTHTDARGQIKTWSDGQEEGSYQHDISEFELPPHTHGVNLTTSSDSVDLSVQTYHEAGNGEIASGATTAEAIVNLTTDPHTHTVVGDTESEGGGLPANITQPTLAVYRWVRTA